MGDQRRGTTEEVKYTRTGKYSYTEIKVSPNVTTLPKKK